MFSCYGGSDHKEDAVEVQSQNSWSSSTGSQHSWQSQSPAPIPEPFSGTMLALGLIIVGLVIRRKLR